MTHVLWVSTPERRHQKQLGQTNGNMRTRTLLSITLLGLLLWASCIQADDTDAETEKETETPEETLDEDSSVKTGEEEEEEEEEEKDAPQKEKTTEIEEERDVMVLHINNFDRALSENQFVLVEFCK